MFTVSKLRQAVDRARVGGRVELVGLASQGGAPVGDLDGKVMYSVSAMVVITEKIGS